MKSPAALEGTTYVNASDKCLGDAYCIACENQAQVSRALNYLKSREEMSRVMTSRKPRNARTVTIVQYFQVGDLCPSLDDLREMQTSQNGWYARYYLSDLSRKTIPSLALMKCATDYLEKFRKELLEKGVTREVVNHVIGANPDDMAKVSAVWVALGGESHRFEAHRAPLPGTEPAPWGIKRP